MTVIVAGAMTALAIAAVVLALWLPPKILGDRTIAGLKWSNIISGVVNGLFIPILNFLYRKYVISANRCVYC